MFSNNKKLYELIKRYGYSSRNLSNEEKDKISKEIENAAKDFDEIKKDLIKEASELFEYNTSNFKQSSEGLKYQLELLKKNEPDYNLLKESLDLDSKTDTFSETLFKNDLDLKNKNIVIKIYRVRTTADVVAQSQTSNNSCLLLLHGTRGQNIEGILKEGFRPSQSGKFGPGVYLTNSSRIAFRYANSFVNDEGVPKKMTYLFVNKVSQTDAQEPPRKLRKLTHSEDPTESNSFFAKSNTPKAEYRNGKKIKSSRASKFFISRVFKDNWQDYISGQPVLKVFQDDFFSKNQVSLQDSPQDKFDSKENKISKGTFQVNLEEGKIAVAHHDLVTPAYLIEIEQKLSLSELVNDILYIKFNVYRFHEEGIDMNSNLSVNSLHQSSTTKLENYSLENFLAELEKEISANQQAQIEFIKSKFYLKAKI